MAISTNSIIHYTDTFEKVSSIIKEGFRIKYCAEEIQTREDRVAAFAHPVISFCDIPLSEAHEHFDLYGHYGIGLTKDWAKKNGVNPVLYISKDSRISQYIGQTFAAYQSIDGSHKDLIKETLVMIKCFTKNYSGPLKRGKIDSEDYKFYDEREWRLVPKRDDINGKRLSIHLDEFIKNKKSINDAISDIRFKFEASDISYIIVDKTSEIPAMVESLRTMFYKTLNGGESDILLSKVCSTEQIIQDY